MKKAAVIAPVLLLLTACASNIPYEIQRDITERKITINAARAQIERYQGQNVRWGGTIVKVENRENESWIEVVGKPLGYYGRPDESDRSLGRFLVRIEGFVDPAIYREDRDLTIFGTLEGRVTGRIDEHAYSYPLVRAKSYYLWTEYYARTRYPYRYYYYPYHYRFHYGYHYPFYRYRFGFHGHHW